MACGSDDELVVCDVNPVETPSPCCAIVPLEAEIELGASYYVPNVFTPNGDGFNDLFGPYLSDSIDLLMSFRVANSDDQEMFAVMDASPNEIFGFWDGKYQDTIYQGHFNYQIQVRTTSGLVRSDSGKACSVICDGSDTPVAEENRSNCGFGTQHNGNGSYDPFLPNLEREACLGG